MKKILIVYNKEKEIAVKQQLKIKKYLLEKFGQRLKIVTLPSDAKKFTKSDLCISLGGDGTILKIAKKIAQMNIPVVGINLGSLGFLAEIDLSETLTTIEKILKGKYYLEKRIMLEVQLIRKKTLTKIIRYNALNDCILHCGASTRVILLRVKVNDEFLADYLGDGIIISTPTGSTAYSLATGGPIVNPLLPVFIISPICPHTLSQRPLIVSSSDKISIEIPDYKSNKNIVLSVDGQQNFVLNPYDKVNIKKSKYTLKLITHPEKTYYKILREKFHWGTVARTEHK